MIAATLTPESPLADMFTTLADKFHANARETFPLWLRRIEAIVQRPAKVSDLTEATFDAVVAMKGDYRISSQMAYKRRFRAIMRVAIEHCGLARDAFAYPSDAERKERLPHVPQCSRRGPALWTKREVLRLKRSAKRLGGVFVRKGGVGDQQTIPRHVWFAAYVTFARETKLPMNAILRIGKRDLTESGMLVFEYKGGGNKPAAKAMFLSKRARRAVRRVQAGAGRRPFAVNIGESMLRIWFRDVALAAKLGPAAAELRLRNGKTLVANMMQAPVVTQSVALDKFTLDSSLAEFVSKYYLPQKLTIRATKTRDCYAMTVRQLRIAISREPQIRDLTEENICKLLRYLESLSLSPHTVQQRQHYMVAICNFASKRRVIDWWVELPRYPVPDTVPDSWSVDDVKALFAACDKMPGRYFDVKAATWWRAFHCVLWSTGERTSAVLAIESQWFNPETRVLAIPGPARKGGLKAMTYDLLPPAASALSPLLNASREAGRQHVFAFPGIIHTFYNHHKRLLKLAGLPHGRRCGPQKMRRTFATFVELAGGNATEALDHSCRRVTTESYLDPTVIRKPAANLLLPSLEEKPKPEDEQQ